MARTLIALAALLAGIAVAAPATAAAAEARGAAVRSPALRSGPGAAAGMTVVARIIRASARVGAGLGPPAPAMTPRHATVSAADGRPVAALVYDFE